MCWPLLFVAAGMVFACGDAKKSALNAELLEKNHRISALTAQNDALELKASRLQETIMELQAELDNLTVKEAELRSWARQLADSFEPGVWFISSDERPLPLKTVPNATAGTLIKELNRLLAGAGLPTITLIKIENDTAFMRLRRPLHDSWKKR